MYTHVCIHVCVYVTKCVFMYVCTSINYTHRSSSVDVSHVSLSLSHYLYVYLSVYLSICHSLLLHPAGIYPSIYTYLRLHKIETLTTS